MKPGYKTSEFWIALVAQIIPFMILFGVVTADEAETVNESITQLIAAIFAAAASIAPIVAYIQGRAKVKANEPES
jgi:hypothetical protein